MIRVTTSLAPEGQMINSGMHIYDIIQQYPELFEQHPMGYFPVAVSVNNVLTALSDELMISCHLELIHKDTVVGSNVYRQSLVFLFAMAFNQCYPSYKLEISHGIEFQYYFKVRSVEEPNTIYQIEDKHVDELNAAMRKLVSQNIPVMSNKSYHADEAIKILERQHMDQAIELIKSTKEVCVHLSQCQNFFTVAHTPLVATTGDLQHFQLKQHNGQIILIYPSKNSPEKVPVFNDNESFSSIYEEYGRWASVLGIQSVGQLNLIVRTEKFKSYIQICESRQNQMLSHICKLILNGHKSKNGPMNIQEAIKYHGPEKKNDRVCSDIEHLSDQIKLVMISGPSSSAKTSFSRKLKYNLTVQGRDPLVLSMDNYFVHRKETPLDENGDYDFECPEAVNAELFNKDLEKLLSGQVAHTPTFDFKTGIRHDNVVPMTLTQRGIIIIEGIHALNPIMTRSVKAENKFGIFIQPLPCITFDDITRLSTRDYRLFRRIIRDRQYRACSAERTIQLFENVRKGEDKWVFPNQQRADIYFNTALDYELLVMAPLIVPQLHEIPPNSPSYMEGRRLLKQLEWIANVNENFVPRHSLLREFIGNSGFWVDK